MVYSVGSSPFLTCALPSGARIIEQGRPLKMLDHPGSDAFEIQREIQFSDRPLSLIGPEDFIRSAQRHAHDNAAI
jgi:hypothetical protein